MVQGRKIKWQPLSPYIDPLLPNWQNFELIYQVVRRIYLNMLLTYMLQLSSHVLYLSRVLAFVLWCHVLKIMLRQMLFPFYYSVMLFIILLPFSSLSYIESLVWWNIFNIFSIQLYLSNKLGTIIIYFKLCV